MNRSSLAVAAYQHGFRAGLQAARWGVYFISGHHRSRAEWRTGYSAGLLHAQGVNHYGRALGRLHVTHPDGGRDALQ